MLNESDIKYETKDYWVLQTPKGYEVYKNGSTHSTRVATIGYLNDYGLNRAIETCNRRQNGE